MFEEEEDFDFERHKQLPVFKKAEDILIMAEKLAELINDSIENKLEDAELMMAKSYTQNILENALIIGAKIAGAEAVELYDIKMENAAIIRKAAREIQTFCTGLTIFDLDELEYLELLREEVELFRVEFAEWVKTFDPWNYIIDRWGLFNPPGVNYDDHDPDDDIPFNPEDFLGEG